MKDLSITFLCVHILFAFYNIVMWHTR